MISRGKSWISRRSSSLMYATVRSVQTKIPYAMSILIKVYPWALDASMVMRIGKEARSDFCAMVPSPMCAI